MAATQTDPSRTAESGSRKGAEPAESPVPPAPGGFKAWLPLILNIVLMPALAFAVTQFVLLPQIKAVSAGGSAGLPDKAESGAEPAGKEKPKFTAALSNKILVNVAGTMGTRYLLATITLVSTNPQVKDLVDQNDAQLRDAAASALSTKTINDLEKPGSRNLIRSELITLFNNVLGNGLISEIYLTEFAIQ